MPLGALCRSWIFTVRALCDSEYRLSHAQTAPWHEARTLWTRFCLGKLPGYVPGADPGVATALLACVIQSFFFNILFFIFYFFMTTNLRNSTGQQEIATLLANVKVKWQ